MPTKSKKKSLKEVLTKRLLKRIKRRAKVRRFNKSLKKKVRRTFGNPLNLANADEHVQRNKMRELAFYRFNMDTIATQNDLKTIPLLLADPNLPKEKKLALQCYYDALVRGVVTAKDRDSFFSSTQSALLRSVPYDGFSGVSDNLKFINNSLPSLPHPTKRRHL